MCYNLFTLEPPTPSNFHCPPKSRRIVVTKMAAQLPVSPEDSSFYSPFKPSPSLHLPLPWLTSALPWLTSTLSWLTSTLPWLTSTPRK